MHWIYLIHEFHNLSWITEINELFHDILIYWDAPVYSGLLATRVHSIIYIEQMTLFALISSFWSSETSIKIWILNDQIYIVGFWTVYVRGLLISMLSMSSFSCSF